MEQRMLFVGGVADGRRIWVDNSLEHYRVPKMAQIAPFLNVDIDAAPVFEVEYYTRIHIRDKDREFSFFAASSIDSADSIGYLIEGYEHKEGRFE